MTDINDIIKTALELGYVKEAAAEWASKVYKENVAREERAHERRLRQTQVEIEQRERDRLHAIEMENIKLKGKECELENSKIQKELAENRIANGSVQNSPDQGTSTAVSSTMKLPLFREGEDISAFILRFERICQRTAVGRDAWATHLGCLLTGKALKVYCSIPNSIANDYDLLKEALLKGFHKTPDTLRNEFRSLRLSAGESCLQFFDSISRGLMLWLERSEVDLNDANDICQFFVRDQFLASIPTELRIYLKERKFKDNEEMIEAADLWSDAHKGRNAFGKYKTHVNNFKPESASDEIPKQEKSVSSPPSHSKARNSDIKCFNCGQPGHTSKQCKEVRRHAKVEITNLVSNYFSKSNITDIDACNFKNDDRINISCVLGDHTNNTSQIPTKYFSTGTINGMHVSSIMRDTGCSAVLVSEQCLPFLDVDKCEKVQVSDFLGRVSTFPKVKCYLKCDFYDGYVDAIRAPLSHCSVLVGNIPGVRDSYESGSVSPINNFSSSSSSDTCVVVEDKCLAVTRAQKGKQSLHPLKVPKLDILNLTPKEFSDLQKSCSTLTVVRDKLRDCIITTVGDRKFKFVENNNILYNVCIESPKVNERDRSVLVVPLECRSTVLKTAHENMLSGHFSARKTELKIKDNFFWPGMGKDIKLFCRSCDLCQRFGKKGIKKAPMEKLPIITEPFFRVSIDLIGPLAPSCDRGFKYVLTLIDVATSFPEAIPLKNIDTVSVAEALLQIFGRVGIPKEIHSDLGTQFVSNLMKEIHRLLGIQPIFNTPYHPQGTGRIERLNGTLKSVLKKLCSQRPKDWDRYLIPTLFAIRELPSDRTGYSAFELLYGRQVRGPLAVLRDIWEDPKLSPNEKLTFQYVLDLKQTLEDSAALAASAADISVNKYKSYFDLKSQTRNFSPGDEVLILLPDSTKKLLMGWRGPYKVIEKRNRVDYLIDEGGKQRLYHVNLLKKYYRRSNDSLCNIDSPDPDYDNVINSVTAFQCVIIDNDNFDDGINHEIVTVNTSSESSSLEEIKICDDLTVKQRDSVVKLLHEYSDVVSSVPGCTSAFEHRINLIDKNPVRSKMYPIPLHLRDVFDEEVDSLLNMNIIRSSSSPYCSPSLLIKKPNGEFRLAIDYRKLNSVTVFDAEPPCGLDEELHRFCGSKYFSELDLSKAYYQIPMSEESIPLTAFATSKGLMEFVRMPFGLNTACASYIRLMRKVLEGLDVAFYFDNILIFSSDWNSHVNLIKSVFQRLRLFGLTVKPSKLSIGMPKINYLGFVIDGDNLSPQHENVRKILDFKEPSRKSTLRSFIGLCSFYARFIPGFATLTSPLTDLLKKGVSEPLPWSDICSKNFVTLKTALSDKPILRLPKINLPFVLRTDASNVGIGAVLFQYHDNVPFPVAYSSRKLLDRESRYSTIEKELLAVVFGIEKFKYFLIGQKFLLEVDHQPLVYLQKFKGHNNRLLRWALGLQSYDFRLVHVKGCDNLGADFLSRAVE